MIAESRIVKPTPRPYQIEAKNNFLSGSGNMLLQLPTGTGKTLTAVIISEGTPGRVLFMAPTGALVYQTCQAYLRSGFWPNVEKADEYTGGPYIPDDREWRRLFPNGRPSVGEFVMNKVVVSTIQTFCDRVDKYREDPFDLIVCDEAHKSLARSWLNTINKLVSFNPKARVLGPTATPTRGDKQSMALLYPGRETPNGIEPQFCYRMPINKGIADGYLVDIVCERGVLPGVDESIWKVGRKKSGEKDITDESLSRSMNNPVCIEGIAHEIFKYAGTRKGIVFLPGVDVTESVCATMNKMRPGCATFVHGKVKPKRDNRRRLRMVEDGEVQFVLGCDCLIEGYDDPSISMVVMARFTGHRGRYEQMLGRGLRIIAKCIEGLDTPEERRAAIKASAKPDVLVLDFANSSRFKLVTVEDVLLDDTAGGGKKSKKLTEYVKKHRDPVDKRAMREQLEILDAMHAFEESLRQSGWVPPKYDFVYERVNLFGYGGTNQRQEMGRKTDAKRPTQEMVRQAEEMMIRNPESMTQGQLRSEIERRREKMVGRKNYGFLLNVCGLDKGKIDGAKLNWHDATYLRKLMMSSGRKSLPDNWEALVAKNRAKRHHGGDE